MGRSILAVVSGFVTVVVLSIGMDMAMQRSGVFPADPATMGAGLFGLALAYRAVCTMIGGALTARLTPRNDARDVWILAGIGFLAGLAGLAAWFQTPNMGPMWYAALIPVTGAPAALLGGILARKG